MGREDRKQQPPPGEQRAHPRYGARSISVGYTHTDAFFFILPDNISEVGIFIPTRQPFQAGTPLRLRFKPRGGETFDLAGRVAWSSEPDGTGFGTGIEFVELTPEQQERLKVLVDQVAAQPRDDGD